MNSVGILAYEQSRSRSDLGSSRIRATWLAKYWHTAELFQLGIEYSAVIFQKSYWLEYVAIYQGIKILDICDPDFLHWRSDCLPMAASCDAVTTSTPELASLVAEYVSSPVVCIPDRLDLECFAKGPKVHKGRGRATIAAWFGYSTNFPTIDAAIEDLALLGFKKLIIMADQTRLYCVPPSLSSALEVVQFPWEFDRLQDFLLEADILINYRLAYGRWRFKSNNKSLFAWATGIPVAHSASELRTLTSEVCRVDEAAQRYLQVHRDYDIRQSVSEYQALIAKLSGTG